MKDQRDIVKESGVAKESGIPKESGGTKGSGGGGSVLKGAAIIGIAGIFVKLLGAIFKIPLTNWIGDLGMSYYQVAYNIYSALIVLSTAGFPVAISRLVSENLAHKNYANAQRIFKVSMRLMGIVGGVSAAICFFGANLLAARVGNPLAASAVRAISPALIFVPLLASFRGFFQGRQNMKPTAISEILEQLVRVIVGFTLARIYLSVGLPEVAAGASFGASAGAAFAMAFMIFVYVMHRNVLKYEIGRGNNYVDDDRTILKRIISIAVPIIIGAEVIPIMFAIDMGIIMNRLQATGWSEVESQRLYGLMGGYCNSLINMPEFLIQAIAISMVPAISHAAAKGNHKDVESSISTGYRLTTLIAFPCMVGLMVLSKPIMRLLYPEQIDQAMQAIPTFLIMCASIVTLAMYETSTGTLQAIGKQVVPVKHVAISALVKVILTFIFVGIHSINVKGAAMSTVIAYLAAFILNERSVKKYAGVTIDVVQTYAKPGLASLIMGAGAYIIYRLLSGLIGSNLAVCIAILFGVVIYGVMVIVMRIATPDEIAMMPQGNKINRLISKFVKWE